jgi:hypothetical protein
VRWPELAGWQWGLGAACAFFVGMAKTGVPGLGIFVVPLLALVVGDARASAGWLLPLLCAADVFAVGYYRRHASTGRLARLVPWVIVGVGVGAAALALDERILRRVVGGIVLVMVAVHVWRKKTAAAPPSPGFWPSLAYGTAAGFATTVANAAGPVMNAYLLSQRLGKEEFIGTGAWFFLVVNLLKVPILAAHGLIGGASLAFDAALLPAVVAGALSGRAIFTRLPQRAFEVAVILLPCAAALPLLFPGLRP